MGTCCPDFANFVLTWWCAQQMFLVLTSLVLYSKLGLRRPTTACHVMLEQPETTKPPPQVGGPSQDRFGPPSPNLGSARGLL